MSETDNAAVTSVSQVEAMVSLLSDTNVKVREACRDALIAQGTVADAPLRRRMRAASGIERRLIGRILAEIHGPRIEQQIVEHLLGEPELERGAILIGGLVDAGEPLESVSPVLDAMADQVMAQLAGQRDPDRDLEVLRAVLVPQLKSVSVQEAKVVDALLHGVTGNHRGMPLPLCMVWLLVARRARIPLVGVNMPAHFLVRYDAGGDELLIDPTQEGGTIAPDLARQHMEHYGLTGADVKELDASDGAMLLRTLRNLVNLANTHGERTLVERCARILQTVGRALRG